MRRRGTPGPVGRLALRWAISSPARRCSGLTRVRWKDFCPPQFDEILGLKEKGFASLAMCTLGYRALTDAYGDLAKVRFPKEKVIFHI